MLQIVIALSAASPIVLQHHTVRVFRYWAGTICRLALGFGVATLVYFGVLYVFVESYALHRPFGAAVFGIGFVLATLLAAIAGTLVSPARLVRIVIPSICALAVMFPVGLNVYFGVKASWQPAYLLYLMGGIWGGYAVAWVTARRAGAPQLLRI